MVVLGGLGIVGGGIVWYKGYLKSGKKGEKVESETNTVNGVEEEPRDERLV